MSALEQTQQMLSYMQDESVVLLSLRRFSSAEMPAAGGQSLRPERVPSCPAGEMSRVALGDQSSCHTQNIPLPS